MLVPQIILVFILFSIANCKENDIVQTLKDQYYDISKVCGDGRDGRDGDDDAAYQCSGLIIRGVNVSTGMAHAWSMKPYNLEKTSFSVAFLRVDTPFLRFPWSYTSGFIIYPPWDTPAHKKRVEALCAFPIDGYTYDRGGKHGCGRVHDDPVGTSKNCNHLGVKSIDDWSSIYFKIRKDNSSFPQRQCGFDMTLSDASDYFEIFLQASRFLRNNEDARKAGYSYKNNEILLRLWDEKNPRILPIQAFFFLLNVPSALEDALGYQSDYFEETGEMVPVVGIRLPTENNRAVDIEQIS